jgi:hypothetical protein
LSLLPTTRLLVLHGASGTGKTSLLQAGILPCLPPAHYAAVRVRAVDETPTPAIIRAIARQLEVVQWAQDRALDEVLHTATTTLDKTLVVVLDQFEEFFLRFPLAVRRQFHRDLGQCLDIPVLAVHFILALREDYVAQLDEFRPGIPDPLARRLRLTRLTVDQATAAIVKPAQRLGLTVEASFLTDILLLQLQDADGTIEPPVLQLVCDALYDQAMETDTPTMGLLTYHALGDVRTWLESYLTDALRRFGPDQADAREVLKALVTAAGTTKRAVGLAELTARLQTVGTVCEVDTLEAVLLPRLVQARLVRTDEAEGTSRYELIHEFLVPPIAAWMKADDRTPLAVLELIAQASERFKRTGLLLEREALQWIIPSEDRLSLSPEQQAFLARSKQAVRQQQRGLRLKVGALVLVVILSVGGVAIWRLYQAKQQLQATNQQLQVQTVEVDTQRQIAEVSAQQAKHQLAALYTEQGRQELMHGKVLRAVAYLSAAYHLEETGSMLRFLLAQALRPLDAQLLSLGGSLLTSMLGHTDVVGTASFSPDGMRLVTASRDGPTQVWEVASGRLLLSLESHTDEVLSASFSADGTRLVTASADKTAKVWNVALETRSSAEVAALVRCRGLWRLNAEGQLLQAAPDLTACPPLAAAR